MPRFQNCSSELKRDLCECWLIVFFGIFVRWNQWRLLAHVPVSPLDPLYTHPVADNQRWAGLFFVSGVLMAILQYRPLYVRRCRHRIHLLMLVAEMWLMLQLAEWLDYQLWQPFLGIIRELLLALGRAQWGAWLFGHLPGVCEWLSSGDAFDAFCLISSFAIFFAALDSTAVYWRKSVNFLLLGCLPENPDLTLFIKEARQQRDLMRRMNGLPPDPSPETLISRRMCHACRQDTKIKNRRVA
ncbi:uncharacterized protein LOC108045063 [Drosophila rhopaloa]|uniref:Uncharacterized protein LOC108045063 n=1 Tax=Drosophila rhopaloa TaxID=1041015 RepID=A0A6P4F311_DRORH|nr:uncharacterized protein LOC108045063 [Drosophila rhopaloa]